MSMTRNDALTQLATGLRRFDGYTAGQVLAAEWSGLKGLHPADLAYFQGRASQPVQEVARACQDRSRYTEPTPATDAQVVLRVPAALKNKWVRASQAEGKKLTNWIIEQLEH